MKVDIIGYDSGWGCRNFKCEDGPESAPIDLILARLRAGGLEAAWNGSLGLKNLGRRSTFDTKEKTLPFVLEGLDRLYHSVHDIVTGGGRPIVLGGDHTSAIGTWAGAATALQAEEKFGLIWIDAHLDSHTYETSKSGKWGGWWHGQPVAALLGHGLPEFTSLGGARAKLSARHITMIGIHSYEPEELDFARQQGIRVHTLDDVRRHGFKFAWDDALARATDGTKGFGLTVDLDAFDPAEAPGVGTPEPEGLHAAEVLPIIKSVARQAGFAALEIAEFNPHNDENGKTAALIENIAGAAFTS